MGQKLKPVVVAGKNGLSQSVLSELESSMHTHEILKIKIHKTSREEKQATIDKIIKFLSANLVQVIGNIIVVYRAFDKDPKIILPRK